MPPLPNLIVIVLLAGMAVYLIWRWFAVFGKSPGQSRLLRTGETADAVIVDVIYTDSYLEKRAYQEVEVVLDVTPAGRAGYRVRTRRAVAVGGALGGGSPYIAGLELKVKIDPNNTKRIAMIGIDG